MAVKGGGGMKKWEYKVEIWETEVSDEGELQDMLDEYGEQGFELINIIPQYQSSSNIDSVMQDVYINKNIFVFKRKAE